MCQFGVWPNCCNNCDFCLREARIPYSKEQQYLQNENQPTIQEHNPNAAYPVQLLQ